MIDPSNARVITRAALLASLSALLLGAISFAAAQGNSPHGDIKLNCETCHVAAGWDKLKEPLQFDHDSQTGFALVGRHRDVGCAECHKDLVFARAPKNCLGCHTDIHEGQFGAECSDCHSPERWIDPAAMASRHNATRFPLSGVHSAVDCQACHSGGRYKDTPLECLGCHLNVYESSSNPDHRAARFSADCNSCHRLSGNGWRNTSYQHTPTFPLTNAHANIECRVCHAGQPSYHFASPLCYSCHQTNYDGVQNPDHFGANFNHDCSLCHSTVAWKPAQFDHAQSRFPLSGKHLTLACDQCHTGGRFTGTPTECYSCHQSAYSSVTDPNHVSGQFNHDCTQCHNTDGWKPATFSHSQTSFPLTGKHQTLTCEQCHIGGRFGGTPSACYDCHQSNYQDVVSPSHAAGQFNHDCTQCHNTDAWKPSTFSHDQTAFPLTGKHQTVNCEQCHIGGQFAGTSTACYNCHQNDYQNVATPSHLSGQFNHDCTQCHNTDGWKPSTFSHDATAFPLTGKHLTINCEQCHIGGQFAGTATECFGCHETDYNGVADPNNHVTGQFNHYCLICHSTDAWTPSTLNHDLTNFPLTGAHRTINCEQCHIGGRFAGTTTECFGCHEADYNGVADPNNHAAGQFNHNCLICHTTDAWRPSTLDHSKTNFPLTGAHQTVNCDLCHIGGRYAGTPTECFGCHETDYNGTTDPGHTAAQLDHNCLVCHNTVAWKPSSFNHDSTTFQLIGAHRTVNCQQCHINGQFAGTPTGCFECHESNYNGVTDPSHSAGQFDHNCLICHSMDAWKPATFNHDSTSFQLTGAHRTVSCQQCHIGGRFAGTPSECFGCHENDFNGVADPSHTAGQFDHNCLVCHSTDAWKPATFNHDSTAFKLTGAHKTVSCQQCHINGRFAGTPTACYGCHENNYTGVSDPNHVSGNYDHNCAACHSTDGWTPAQFDHSNTPFPLTGAHKDVDCSKCHAGGKFNNTPTDCYFCHENDYTGANDPNHSAAGFPHDCEQCHNMVRWNEATFDHDGKWFPIYSGSHNGRWSHCSDCHSNPNDFSVFTCISCHEHSRANTDEHHNEVHNYQYNSAACYQCHPQGRAGDGFRLPQWRENIKDRQ